MASESETDEEPVAEATEIAEDESSSESEEITEIEESEETIEEVAEIDSEETDDIVEPEEIEETAESEEPEAEVEELEEVEVTEYSESIVVDSAALDFEFDNDAMAEGFISREMNPNRRVLYASYDFDSLLSSDEQYFFPDLCSHISAVANGQETSTSFTLEGGTYTAEDLGLDDLNNFNEIYDAFFGTGRIDTYRVFTVILDSMPYDMYWCDKCTNISWYFQCTVGGDTTTVTHIISVPVADEYQDTKAATPVYTVNSKYGTAVSTAVATVRTIINTYAGLDDYSKLEAYCRTICDMVDYNDEAAESEDMPYGNPWQMIWVFDNDPATKVVCEGYSKAFQYLCDNSHFTSDSVYSICAYGYVYFTTAQGNHMWNVVHMEDGNNYLVDVTNCDGDDELSLFMKGAVSGSVDNGYYIDGGDTSYYRYNYDRDMHWYYPATDLVLASSDYEYSPLAAGWQKIDNRWYYKDADGSFHTGWLQDGKWYYFNSDGVMQTGWQKVGGKWYYFAGSGAMTTGWKKIGSSWYYFEKSGAMVTGWKKIGSTWYYFQSSGAMKTGWLKLSGKWYYLESSGAMVTGDKKINGKVYHFNSSGVCQNP